MAYKTVIIFWFVFFSSFCEYNHCENIKTKYKNYKAFYKYRLSAKTKNGEVQGRKINNMIGFNGIPYAKPPVGELRFEPPQEADSWNGIWNATYDRNHCVQVPITFSQSSSPDGDEDCLYVNVYVPQKFKGKHLIPVMVWIHGGSFLTGSSEYSLYGPDNFVQQDVIVVTFNYRLGIFGFLSTSDKAAPGNNGIKDQILALKWVRKNIKAFGGDPTKVTIFGQSAGGASVSYLVLSPLAKGLFKGAIIQSGSSLCAWSLSRKAEKAAYMVGQKLNIQSTNSKDLVEQLKKIPAYNLQMISMAVMGEILIEDPLNGLLYAPVIEPLGVNSVITNYSYDALSNGDFNQVPQIIGYNSAEAISFASLLKVFESSLAKYDLMPANLVPDTMNLKEEDMRSIGEKIKTFYSCELGRNAFQNINFLKFMSDDQFVRPVHKTAELTALYTRTYLYRFSYKTYPNATGAGHGDDLLYLFNSPQKSEENKAVTECLINLWTNFAKTNDPTPYRKNTCRGTSWKPIEPKDRHEMYYLNIDVNAVLDENPDMVNIQFWERLFKQYGYPPYETY